MWKKYLSESHPNALDKCLDALQNFLDFADPKIVTMAQNDIIRGLVEKCIGNPKTKLKGIECFNLLFEVTENFDEPSSETIIELLNSKTLKVYYILRSFLLIMSTLIINKIIQFKMYSTYLLIGLKI